MNPYIKTLTDAQMDGKIIPDFRTGDTLSIQLRVRDSLGEGAKKTTRERLQTFMGVVLGRKNKALNSSVTLHRIVEGESVTLVIPLYSPLVANIEVKRRGDVRRAKIYYLSSLRGKAARIKERYIKKVKAIAPDAVMEATDVYKSHGSVIEGPVDTIAIATEHKE